VGWFVGVLFVLVTTVNPAKTTELIEMPFGSRLTWAQGCMYSIGVHIDATWRIRRLDWGGDGDVAVATITVATYLNYLSLKRSFTKLNVLKQRL